MIGNRRGFSLLEVLTVVGIIGILATVALPKMEDMLSHYRLTGAVQELVTSLQLLRIKAIAANDDAYLLFWPTSDRFYTAYVDLDDDGIIDSPSEVEATGFAFLDTSPTQVLGTNPRGTFLPSGVSFGYGTWGTDVTKRACTGSDTAEPSDTVTFPKSFGIYPKPKFHPSGSNAEMGTAYLTHSEIGQFYAVSVAITGRIKKCRWTGSAWE